MLSTRARIILLAPVLVAVTAWAALVTPEWLPGVRGAADATLRSAA